MHYDLIVKIKNAEKAGKNIILVPFSGPDFSVAKVLAGAGYLSGVQKKVFGKKSFMEIKLRQENGGNVIDGFKIISKPGRRIYVGYRDVKPVKYGHGMGIISTPGGILSDKEARKSKVGGEYLLEIW